MGHKEADIHERHVLSDFTTGFTSLICLLLAVKFAGQI
jgi:hypothetical protein